MVDATDKPRKRVNQWIDQVELSVWRNTSEEMCNIPAIEQLRKEIKVRVDKIKADCENKWEHGLFSWGDI